MIFLKQTFPTSVYKRKCDAFIHIMNKYGLCEAKKLNLKECIEENETYMYRVFSENKKLKTLCISLFNFEKIKEKYKTDFI